MKTIFDLCEPRKDVAKGDIAKSDFAADLAQVIKGTASDEYLKADLFFSNTYQQHLSHTRAQEPAGQRLRPIERSIRRGRRDLSPRNVSQSG